MKKHIFFATFCLLAYSAIFYPLNLFGSTVISNGTINDDEHWTKQGSPYLLKSDLVINPGQKLTIDPGVIVKSDNAYMSVLGMLVAKGIETEKIIFTSLTDDSVGGDSDIDGMHFHDDHTFDARGLFFDPTSSDSVLQNIEMRYNSDGISFSSSTALLSGIYFNHDKLGLSLQSSNVNVDNLTASDTGFVVSLNQNSHLFLSSSTVNGSLDSNVFNSDGSVFVMKDVVVKNTGEYEPLMLTNSTGTLDHVTFQGGNQNGIDAVTSSLSIINSLIEGFSKSGLSLQSGFTSVASSSLLNNSIGLFFKNKKSIGISYANDASSRMYNVDTFIDRAKSTLKSLIYPKEKVYADAVPVQISDSNISKNSLFGIQNISSSTVSAEHNYWGDDSGPFNLEKNQAGKGDAISGAVNFSPWTRHSLLPSCCSNVLFIPGIEGSRLYEKGIFSENQLWEPNVSEDVERLILDQKGGPSNSKNIYTRDIISSTNILPVLKQDIYKSFSSMLDFLVSSGSIHAWKAVPYDWRYGTNDIIESGIQFKDKKINIEDELLSLASISKTGKVTIIAHSNGGLVAKTLLKKLQAKNKDSVVDKVILVGSPQLGTPESIPALLHGDDQSLMKGLLISQAEARKFAVSMPSAYGLLPSRDFFSLSGTSSSFLSAPLITFDPSIDDVSNLRKTYGNTISDFEKMTKFLKGLDGRKGPTVSDTAQPAILKDPLLSSASLEHANMDSFSVPTSTQLIQIAGVGLNTTNGVVYFYKKEKCQLGSLFCLSAHEIDHRSIKTTDGDGVVIAQTAALSKAPSLFVDLHKINIDSGKNFAHSTIMEVSSILNILKNIILNLTVEDNDYVQHSYSVSPARSLSQTPTSIVLSVHSPVSIDVYDQKGNHTGIVSSSDPDISYVEENIPNSSYSEEGEGKYIYLDAPETLATTTVKIQGTGVGSFSFDEEISDRAKAGEGTTSSQLSVKTYEFEDIPVTEATNASFVFTPRATDPVLSVDEDGDGKSDLIVHKNETLDPYNYLELIKKMIPSYNLPKNIEKLLLTKIDTLEKLLKNSKNGEVIKKIKEFLAQLGLKKWKVRKIQPIEKIELGVMLTTLLENLQNNFN